MMYLPIRGYWRYGCLAVLLASTLCGCQSGMFSRGDDYSSYPNGTKPRRWSKEWYAESSGRPVGSRQKEYKGKLWPPYPRPTGEKQECCHKFHAAHYWPFPYNCWDQGYVNEVAALQEANGWRNETTLYAQHFDHETNHLNHAGILKLEWIMLYAPPQHRAVYVQAHPSEAVNETRISAVTVAATEMAGPAAVPPVSLRAATVVGRPAVEVEMIREKDLLTTPTPRILYQPVIGGGQ